MSGSGVDVVIVNWNSGAYLAKCVASVDVHGDAEVKRIVVVDNASTDRSDDVTTARVPLEIVRNASNVGFGAACNIGARRGRAEFILFLNPDAWVEATSIATCVAGLRMRPDAWVAGARLFDNDGTVQRTCCRAPTVARMIARATGIDRLLPSLGYMMVEWTHDATRYVDHVIGAFYLIRRDVFERLGGFDERFFMYLEDLDLSLRVLAAGGKCLFAADATAHHAGGGTTRNIKATRLFYSVRSRLQFATKHFGVVSAALVWFASLTVEPLLRSVSAVLRGSKDELSEVWGGYAQLLRWMAQ